MPEIIALAPPLGSNGASTPPDVDDSKSSADSPPNTVGPDTTDHESGALHAEVSRRDVPGPANEAQPEPETLPAAESVAPQAVDESTGAGAKLDPGLRQDSGHQRELDLFAERLAEARAIANACAGELNGLSGLRRALATGWLSESQSQLIRLDRQAAQIADAVGPSKGALDAAWRELFDVSTSLSAARVEADVAAAPVVSLNAVLTRLRLVLTCLAAQLALCGIVLGFSMAALMGWSMTFGSLDSPHSVNWLWATWTWTKPSTEPVPSYGLIVLGSLLGMLAVTTHLNWKFRHRWDALGFLPWYAVKLLGAPIITLTVVGLLTNFQVKVGDTSLGPSTSSFMTFALSTLTGLFSNSIFAFLREKTGAALALNAPRNSVGEKPRDTSVSDPHNDNKEQ